MTDHQRDSIAPSNWLERSIATVAPGWALSRSMARVGLMHARSYDAGKVGRRTQGWVTHNTSDSASLAHGLSRIQSRARDLIENNEYAKRAADVFASNVVGYGITMTLADKREQAAWDAWTLETACDADGVDNLGGLLRLGCLERFSVGEGFIRRRWRRASDGLAVPMQLQFLEAEHLDVTKTGPVGQSGNKCVLGKEYDTLGRCVAYWMFAEHPGELVHTRWSSLQSQRIPADDIIHYYRRRRPSAVRGVSELAVSMMRYRDLADYIEAEQVRKKMEACVVGIISSNSPDKALGLPDGKGRERMSPGMLARIGAADNVAFNNPTPSSGGGEFTRHQLHALAVGSGITYAQLTGDMSQANFASNRMGLIEFRAMVEQEQWLTLAPQVLARVRQWFQEACQVAGISTGQRSQDKYSMPRKAQVDPLKDTLTAKEQIKGGGMTLSEWQREQGTTLDAYIQERQAELAKLKAAGIITDTDPDVTELGLTGADLIKAEGKQPAA